MNSRQLWWLCAFFAVYCLGFFIDVMDVDAAQYASISREMMTSGNYLQVMDRGIDYLDKPPFLFWVSAASMKFFGVNNFAYRFPSFVFSILALYATYRFALLYYSKQTALLALLVLASCQAFFLINHDVRTDTILMSFVITVIWQLAEWYEGKGFYHFILAFIAIGGGMLTKGPIALIVPALAFGTHFLLQRSFFKMFLKWQYIPGIFIIGLVLLPMCTGLYHQFDLQPQKTVNGATGVSGLRFFFWTQSFGRITGESVWNNNKNIFFLYQNMLWALLPWILFFTIGFIANLRTIIQQKFRLKAGQEWISTGGFLLTYLALGSSKYQLPHYIFVVFPLAAVVTANFLQTLVSENKHVKVLSFLKWLHSAVFLLLWLAIPILLYCFGASVWLMVLAFAFIIFYGLYCTKKFTGRQYIFFIGFYSIAGINLFLNGFIYPQLLRYQAGSTAGRWIAQHQLQQEKIVAYQFESSWSLCFYGKKIIPNADNVNDIASGQYVLLAKQHLQDFEAASKKYSIVFEGEDFHVSGLKIKFLNPATRKQMVTPFVLIKML